VLVGKNWPKALQIVDEGGVKCFVAENSKRRVYQVRRGGPAARCLQRAACRPRLPAMHATAQPCCQMLRPPPPIQPAAAGPSRRTSAFTPPPRHQAALQVQGKSGSDPYIVFPAHFCTCHFFHYEVVGKGEATHVSWKPAARRALPPALAAVRASVRVASWALPGPRVLLLTPPAVPAQCKHQLAARMAQALQRCPDITVPDAALAAILLHM
jgi:hypothetical protein